MIMRQALFYQLNYLWRSSIYNVLVELRQFALQYLLVSNMRVELVPHELIMEHLPHDQGHHEHVALLILQVALDSSPLRLDSLGRVVSHLAPRYLLVVLLCAAHSEITDLEHIFLVLLYNEDIVQCQIPVQYSLLCHLMAARCKVRPAQ